MATPAGAGITIRPPVGLGLPLGAGRLADGVGQRLEVVPVGPVTSYRPSCRTSSHPRGAVSRIACASHRS